MAKGWRALANQEQMMVRLGIMVASIGVLPCGGRRGMKANKLASCAGIPGPPGFINAPRF